MSAPPFLSKRIRRISFPVRPAAPRLPIPAVAGAFKLAGYDGPLVVAPVASEDERGFLLEPDDLRALRDVRTLEQVLQQFLGRKVFVVERSGAWGAPIPFD